MKKTLFAVLASVVAAYVYADTTLDYAIGATDLGGKVVITYDGASKITALVATPDGGETLTIVSNAMTFAAGAAISVAADGRLVFANDVTAEGALSLNRTDGAYYEWTGSKSDVPVSANKYVQCNSFAISPSGRKLVDWDLVGVYAFADSPLERPISKNAVGTHAAETDDSHGTWTESNLGGAYTRIYSAAEGDTGRWYVFNRWTGEYTYSIRFLLYQEAGWNGLHLRARTGVRGPQDENLPDENLWENMSSSQWTGWYGYGNEGKPSGTYKGDAEYLGINRAVIRKYGSEIATVGFSGNVALGGTTDVALGVKLAVLPNEGAVFKTPVFTGEGDVEYGRDAILSNPNRMKYASELTVTNATIYVADAGAFPTNAIVTVCEDATICFDSSITAGEATSDRSNVDGSARSVSGGWYDLNVKTGGQLLYTNLLCNGRVEVAYDETEPTKIRKLVARPAGGETVAVPSAQGAMTFVDGATIEMASDGKLVFENDVTAEGALSLVRTDGAYYSWTGTRDCVDYDVCGDAEVPVVSPAGSGRLIKNWDLVGLYAFADAPLVRPIASSPLGTLDADSDDAHGAWTWANLGGAFEKIGETPAKEDGENIVHWYVFNRWTGEHTYSVRAVLLQKKDTDQLKVSIRTGVKGPRFGRYPGLDLWQVGHASGSILPKSRWSGRYGREGDASNAGTYYGDTKYLRINRVVMRRIGSDVATVAFAGDVTLGGETDVALGVKLALLPGGSGSFAAPVFTGEGDVEYGRDATLANANLMKYASRLSVTNANVEISRDGTFPTNATVNIWAGGSVAVNWGTGHTVTSGISGERYDLNVHDGGQFRLNGGNGYDGGVGNCVRAELDGGALWFGYPVEYAAGEYQGARYVNYLTLGNGAEAKGNQVRVGNSADMTPCWHSAGPLAPAVNCDIDMVGIGGDCEFVFFVEDIPGVDADCVLNKNVLTHNNSDTYRCSFVKTGAGTLKMNGTISARMATKVEEGALVFGASGDMAVAGANKDIELSGGATLGKEAGAMSAGTLSFEGDATLDIGDGASMSFDDSSGQAWTGTLTLRGFRYGGVRFGTDSSGLTEGQLSQIRTDDGRKVRISRSGYLIAKDGFIILFN